MTPDELDRAVQEAQFETSRDIMGLYANLHRALESGQNRVQAMTDMGAFLVKLPSYELRQEATHYFDRAHHMDADNLDALIGGGIAAWKTGDMKKALARLTRANDLNPSSLIPAFLLGAKHLKDGDHEAVVKVTHTVVLQSADQGCSALYCAAHQYRSVTPIANFKRLFGASGYSAMKTWAKHALQGNSRKQLFKEIYSDENGFGLTFAFGLLSHSPLIKLQIRQPKPNHHRAALVISG